MTEHDTRRWQHRRPSKRQRLSRRTILALAIAAGVLVGGGGTAWALTTGEPAQCTGGVPTVDDGGLTHLGVECVFTAPAVTVTVPGPTVTVPGPTFTTTETVTLPPVVSTTTITQTVTVTPTTTKPPTTTPPPTTPPPTTPTTGWPDANNTGVPAGVLLTTYTGPCTITTANTVIDSKTVNCTLSIRAANVTIRNSRINGGIENGTGAQPGRSFTVTDTDIFTGTNTTGIAESYYTALRVDISGGNRGANCFTDCTVRDSYIHGNRVTGDIHASGLRAGMNTTYVHNYLQCTVGGNCSADLTGYPDFSITTNWTITGNFFGAVTDAQWCAYDGAVGGKPYSNDPNNATNIRFVDNVFARGGSRKCGQSSPVSFDGGRSRPGWVFTGNRFDDGVLIP